MRNLKLFKRGIPQCNQSINTSTFRSRGPRSYEIEKSKHCVFASCIALYCKLSRFCVVRASVHTDNMRLVGDCVASYLTNGDLMFLRGSSLGSNREEADAIMTFSLCVQPLASAENCAHLHPGGKVHTAQLSNRNLHVKFAPDRDRPVGMNALKRNMNQRSDSEKSNVET